MEPETLKQIIKLLQKLFESYIYVDIAQNPPDVGIPNYHHRKINLIEELGNIKTENRKFYEFYQEIQTILSVVRDGHLSISSYTTPKGIQFFEYWAVNAFRYIIKEYKGEQRIFITIREDYINKYDNNTQTFLRNHLEIPIKSINDMDPFDYIQSWSQFICVKNQIHSKFVHNLYYIPGFYLLINPLNYTEFIENEFEFEDNKIIRVSYIIGKPEIKSEKFKQFFINMVKKYRNERFLPPIDELKNIFLHKNILNQELKTEEKKINWDVEYSENKEYIKCRVDNENQVNVLAQNTFYLDFQISAGKIMYCAKLFHSNNYPIILIEDRNTGGYPNLAYLMIQLFQMREVERTYSAMKYNEINKKYLNIEKSYGEYIYNPDTCEMINSFDNFSEIIDYYNYSGLNITHKRTNAYVELNSLSERKAYNEFRKKYENSSNLKRPTDIIIFTDGYAFSSGSTFIKGLQNIGGAIIVGFLGNPKINGTDLFDASQSDSGIFNFDNTEISKNLSNLGFHILGFTFIEVFDDSYKSKNPIPREYQMIPVDYRVDIYSFYSDDNYDEFIKKGKDIHKLFNEGNYCNFNNKKLLLHDDNKCKNFDNLEHAHGGFKCGKNNQWDKNDCAPYYCDIGYSFDQHLKKCVKDCMVDWPVNFIFEDNFTNTYNISHDEKLEFITLNHNGSYYVFESSENYIDKYPKICFIKGMKNIVINKDKKSEKDIILNINTIKSDINIMNYRAENILFDKLLFFKEKKMFIFQSSKKHILLINKILNNNNKNNNIKYLKYNNSIKYQDILNINNEYFIDYSANSFILEKEETYIIYFNYDNQDQIFVNINPIESNENISFAKNKMNYLYLQKGNIYTLEFPNDILDIMIKLSRETSNSEVSIEDNTALLNSDNLYYHYIKSESKKLKIKVEKNDAIIEFLYNLTTKNVIEDVNFEKSVLKLDKEINILKIPKKFKNINIELLNNNNNALYSIYQGYSILPFSHYSEADKEDRMSSNITFKVSEPYSDEIKVKENEYYIIMIRIFEGNLNIMINGEKESANEKKGLEWYYILLIIIGSILIIIIIFVIIIIIKRRKGISNDDIEEKIEGLTEV